MAVGWTRRHPWQTALAAVIALALVAVAAVVLTYGLQLRRANSEVAARAEQQRKELVRFHLANGQRESDDGDFHAALISYAEAARLNADHPETQLAHRLRFSIARRQSAVPLHEWRHERDVRTAVFDTTEKLVATGGDDGMLRLWDTESGAPVGVSTAHGEPVMAVCFRPDDTLPVTRTASGALRIWKGDGTLASGPLPANPPTLVRFGRPAPAEFSPDGNYIVTLQDRAVNLRSLTDASVKTKVLDGFVQHAAFSPDGAQLLTCSDTGMVRLHAVPSLEVVTERNLETSLRHADWSPDGTIRLPSKASSVRTARASSP